MRTVTRLEDSVAAATDPKAEWRVRLLAARRARPAEQLAAAGAVLAEHVLTLCRELGAQTIAGHLSMPGEPPTGPSLAALHAQGLEVLVPVTLPDRDLDWAVWRPDLPLRRGAAGNPEPAGPRLGAQALSRADLVLAPGLAADADGVRLGRGGGSYDRALHRVRADTPVAVLLFDEEVVARLPADPHDQPVGFAITPSGLHRLGPHRPAGH